MARARAAPPGGNGHIEGARAEVGGEAFPPPPSSSSSAAAAAKDDVNPFYDADENKTYEDKVSPAMLKVDWRFPRPGILYPLYARNRFLVGWNAVRIMRETEGTDEAKLRKYERTALSTLSYCFSRLWYLLPTPLVFLFTKVVVAPAQPLVRKLHRAVVLAYARLRLTAASRARAKGSRGRSEPAETSGDIAFVLEAYHGSVGPLEVLVDAVKCLKRVAMG